MLKFLTPNSHGESESIGGVCGCRSRGVGGRMMIAFYFVFLSEHVSRSYFLLHVAL